MSSMFTNIEAESLNRLVVRCDVSGVPDFQEIDGHKTTCRRIRPVYLLAEYNSGVLANLLISCKLVRKNGSAAKTDVQLKWSRSSTTCNLHMSWNHDRDVPEWAIGFLEPASALRIVFDSGSTVREMERW